MLVHRIYLASFLCTPQIREVWNSYELDLVNYQNKCRLIRGWDDLFNKVKEHINSVSAMKLSPYYKVECFFYLLALSLNILEKLQMPTPAYHLLLFIF